MENLKIEGKLGRNPGRDIHEGFQPTIIFQPQDRDKMLTGLD